MSLAVAASNAAAQGKSDPATPTAVVEITSSKLDARKNDVAGRIVVDRTELLQYGDTRLTDVLRRLPGITVGGVPGRSSSEIQMRGLGAGYAQVLVNGDRVPAGFSVDSINPQDVERVEIVRSAVAEFSANAIAGTLNIVLRKSIKPAQRRLLAGIVTTNDAVGQSTSYSQSDKQGDTSYSLRAGGGHFPQRLSSSYEEQAGVAGAQDVRHTTVASTGFVNAAEANLRVSRKLGPADQLSAQIFTTTNVSHTRTEERQDRALAGIAGSARTDDTSRALVSVFKSSLDWTHATDFGEIENSFVLNYFERSNTATILTDQGSQASDYTNRNPSYTWKGKVSSNLSESHKLDAGWTLGHARRRESNLREEATPGAPGVRVQDDVASRANEYAVYVQDEWKASKVLSLYLGLRYERLDLDSATNGRGVSNATHFLAPSVQALWKLDDKYQLRYAFSRTYRAPELAQLSGSDLRSVINTPATPDSVGNPNLRAEQAFGHEVSVEHYFKGGMLSVGVYSRAIHDVIMPLLEQRAGRWVATFSNDGGARVRGLELDSKVSLKKRDQNNPDIDFRLNANYNYSRVEAVPGPDNRLANQIPFSATAGIDFKPQKSQLSYGASYALQTAGPQRTGLNTFTFGSVSRNLDGYALWAVERNLQVRFAVRDLLHQTKILQTRVSDGSWSYQRTEFKPAYPTFRVLVEKTF